jgi:hypothetical protein
MTPPTIPSICATDNSFDGALGVGIERVEPGEEGSDEEEFARSLIISFKQVPSDTLAYSPFSLRI